MSGFSTLKDKAKRLAYGSSLYNLTLAGIAPHELSVVPSDPWPGNRERGRDLIEGRQNFVGQNIEAGQIVWAPFGVDDVWLKAMHGFEWLRDLRSVNGDAARRKAREYIESWLDDFEKWDDTAWHPGVTGLRVSSWLAFHDFYCASADDEFRARVFASILAQGKHLSRVLPANLRGLDLLLAVKGLIYTGVCFEDGEKHLEMGLDLLDDILDTQLTNDGCHLSRNPETQMKFLQHLIDLRGVLSAGGIKVGDNVQNAINVMAVVLRSFCHPDGGLGLFHGGQEGDAVLCESVLKQSSNKAKRPSEGITCGYERLAQGRSMILVDVGAPPEDEPSAHAGLFGFEMSVGKERLFVNCGAHPAPGKWADLMKTTAAHSTMTIEDQDAVRFKSDGSIAYVPEISFIRDESDGACLIEATHDGYFPHYGLTYRRCLFLGNGGENIRGEDRLIGSSCHDYTLRFHLHPNVNASLVKQGREVLLLTAKGLGWRMKFSGGEINIEESIYLGQGTQPRRTSQITVSGRTQGDGAVIKWALMREKRD